ncbi:5-formyltetrahydrofolate cyclo-ligase [Vibrio variabilis]|uniref:5-formyltetrahydrofolate cyclo-ligase n=1 Tax=Vibrio variabilis TaxID=990271 RepID=A0ABQ0JGK6_9VIBR|nr:5-formyltetrahydrofolate cyclo-ligase [Vibrio variabilis]
MSLSTRQQIRTLIRGRRQAISSDQQIRYSNELVERAKQLPELSRAKKIALYLATDGELDAQPMIEWCWQQGIDIYLP